MIEDLTWNNYLELNDLIKQKNFKIEYFSPVVLIQWMYYDINFKFHKTDDFILLYLNKKNSNDDLWCVYASYYFNDIDIHKLKYTIKQDLEILNNSNRLNFIDLLPQTIIDWNLAKYKFERSNYISNYIYELEKMKKFEGKKLQKKRNHLNAFLKENYNVTIKDFREVDKEKILFYCDEHIKRYAENYRQYEYDIYYQYIMNESDKDDRYVGTVIFIDDKIVAFTFGFLNFDTFEVIIEKADREIRGLYQFLIVKNLEFHNINCKYMDREDDAGIEELAKSKKSYYPLLMIERFCSYNVQGWYDENN